MRQKFDTVEFGYEDEFFLRGWIWDSETHPHPAPLSSLMSLEKGLGHHNTVF